MRQRLSAAENPHDPAWRADLAASFQAAVADCLVDRTARAITRFSAEYGAGKALVVAGGVAANASLRARLSDLAAAEGMAWVAPAPALCTDNAAMIAWAGLERFAAGQRDGLDFAPRPRWPLDMTSAGASRAAGGSRCGRRRLGHRAAQVTARAGNEVALWARDPAVVLAINTARRNPRYLSDLTLDPAVRATADLAAAITAAEAVLLAVPAQTVRGLAAALAATGVAPTTAVICAKGLEIGSGKLLSEVLGESLPGWPVAVLSGPSFAGETAAGVPTAVTVAADSLARAAIWRPVSGRPVSVPMPAMT